jgi:pyruvate/2-oxoglutarate dehydrogenase complex dihydrolipoamide acyltransferase (E2) component
MIDIMLPAMAWDGTQDATEALLDKWLVAPGVPVKKGQVLVSVVLVKAAMDIEAPQDGQIVAVLVQSGESFAPGTVLAQFAPAA